MPTLSEAIRRLVEMGLTVKTKAMQTGRLSAAAVADLAAEAIDSLGPKAEVPARPVGRPGRGLRAQELTTIQSKRSSIPLRRQRNAPNANADFTKVPAEFRDARRCA